MKIMRKIIGFCFMAFALVFVACETTEGDPDGKKDINNPSLIVSIESDITEDITFYTDSVYVVDGTIRIRDAKLTFQPGTTVKFTIGSGFDVAYSSNTNATLKALGTEESPILFTSNEENPKAGDWDGLRFFEGSNDCEFEHCVFEYGGKDDYYGFIMIEDAEVSFKNCTLQHSSTHGFRLKSEGMFEGFDGNTLKDIEDYPISVYVNNVASITGDNIYETTSGIWIENDESYTNRGEETWTNQGVPYYPEGTIRFGADGNGSVITIEAGAEFRFMEDAQWDVAYSSNKYAKFIAKGTAEQPILFSSANPSPKMGDWRAIRFYEGANDCEFDHCVFEYGGGKNYGMVSMADADVAITNCEFNHCSSDALHATQKSAFTSFGGNIFKDIAGFDIYIYPNYVHTITGTNTYEDGSSILVSNDDDLDISGDYLWTNQNIPYIIEGRMRIGAAGNGVNLNIEAGTNLLFYSSQGFQIAYSGNNYGSLIASGTSENPIVFSSADPNPDKGDWVGLQYYEGSRNCVLNYCEINYAGSTGGSYGAVTLIDAGSPLSISNTLISFSSSHAISVDKNKSSVVYTNNVTFESNEGSDYKIR